MSQDTCELSRETRHLRPLQPAAPPEVAKEAYPNPPTIQPRRVVGSGDVWVIEARSDYGDGQIFNVAMIVEFRDGKIWRDTRYYAEPFEAPAWRAQWVEPMEE
jgi:hypothetical protein